MGIVSTSGYDSTHDRNQGVEVAEYVVVLEPATDGSWSAYVPDLPGVVSCGRDRAEAETGIRAAIELHRDELQSHGESAPAPRSGTAVVAV